jgi:hypothetical protein
MRSRFIGTVKNNPSLPLDKVENFLAEWEHDKPSFDLQARVDALIEKFHDDEPGISGRSKSYLELPSGRVENRLGVFMHYPTFASSSIRFLNEGNPSTQQLIRKGLNESNIFGFDLHWRRERVQASGKCPTRRYSKDLLALHHKLSRQLLKIVPMPFTIMTGDCVKKWYQKTHSTASISIDLGFEKPLECLLEMSNNSIRRICICVPHPSKRFYGDYEHGAAGLRY